MQDVNVKFKDAPPSETVSKIKEIINSLGIRVTEHWKDSGLENCWSLNLKADGLFPIFSNGKGITKELAAASAYAEFVERIQSGIMLYKYQSIARDKELYLQSFAPDGKYVTSDELIADGEWMDHIIDAYKGGLTREKIAKMCRTYSCADEDKIWVVPYYSLFEKKHVYLPIAFVEQIYATNGLCAGNTREEAWVHAFSEILERHNTVELLVSGKPAKKIPDSVISKFPVASKILNAIRENKMIDVDILDLSLGFDYPVVATRIINKASHGYRFNVGADPIFEIALDRTLTEMFQGTDIKNVGSSHAAVTLDEFPNFPKAHNVFNQLERGNGLFSIDFFTEDDGESFANYTDHSTKSNKELLDYAINAYKGINRPVYIRNYSFLGFHTYHFVVPGFSEAQIYYLFMPINEYAMGDSVRSAWRNVESASKEDLTMLLTYYKRMATVFSKQNNFCQLSCLHIDSKYNALLLGTTLAYASYKLGKLSESIQFIKLLTSSNSVDGETADYLRCVSHYLTLKSKNIPEEKANKLLKKFYVPENVDKLFNYVKTYDNPFYEYLLRCNKTNCEKCKYFDDCAYADCRKLFETVGARYNAFADGQKEENFAI